MGVVRVALAAIALGAGCYQPEVADCVVACSAGDRCAEGQICGADGWCAAPEVAGGCVEGVASDDARGPDAPAADAAPRAPDAARERPDATPPPVELRVVISGRGRVVGPGIDCSTNHQGGTCAYLVPAGAAIEVAAVEVHHHWRFDGWTAGCAGASPACTVVAPATVAADFVEEADDGA